MSPLGRRCAPKKVRGFESHTLSQILLEGEPLRLGTRLLSDVAVHNSATGFRILRPPPFFFLLTFNIWISLLYSKSFHIFNNYKVTSANLELTTSTSKLKLQVEIFNFLFKLEKIIEKASSQNNFSTFLRIFSRFLEMLRMKIDQFS